MSWDVVILDGSVTAEGLEAPGPRPRVGSVEEVRRALGEAWPGLEWSGAAWGAWRTGELCFEVDLGGTEGDLPDFTLHVRGAGDPLPEIVRLCSANGWGALDLGTGALLDLAEPSRKGWRDFVGFRQSLGAEAAQRDLLALPAARLAITPTLLRWGPPGDVLREHPLGDVTDLTYGRGVNPFGLALFAGALAAAIAAAALVPVRWLAWGLAALLGALALAFALGVPGEYATFRSGGRKAKYWLAGPAPEVAAFRTALRDAVERARREPGPPEGPEGAAPGSGDGNSGAER